MAPKAVSVIKLGPRGGRWRHTISSVETWTPLNELAEQEVDRRRSQLFAIAASASVDGTCNDIACEGEEEDLCQLAPVVVMEPATKEARKATVDEAYVEDTFVEAADDEGDEGDGRGKEGACNEGSKEDCKGCVKSTAQR